MLWRNRTLVEKADDPTLLFDTKQCKQAMVTGQRRGDAVTTADTAALKKLRASFRTSIMTSLSGSGIAEQDLHETLAMSHNWCCAGFAREFLSQKLQLVDGETTEEIILKPSQIKVRTGSTCLLLWYGRRSW